MLLNQTTEIYCVINPRVGLLTHVCAGTDTDLHDVQFITRVCKMCEYDV